MIDGIAHHGNRAYGSLSGDTKSKKRCGLHLDREYAIPGPFIELRFGLSVRGIRRPHLPRADGPSRGDQLPLEKRNHRRLARDHSVWRQVVIRGSLVTNRAGCHHKARERQIGRHTAGGSQPDDEFGPRSLQLLGNQYRVGSADGSRDDSAGNTFKIHREHRGVKTCPGPEGLGYAISNQPVGDISIELKDTQGRKDPGRYLPASSHIIDQVLGGECGRLIQRMAEDRRSRIFRHALHLSHRRVRLEIIFIPRRSSIDDVDGRNESRVSYCASIHLSEPTSLTDTFEKKIRAGLPSAVPRWSVEIRRGPAFL